MRGEVSRFSWGGQVSWAGVDGLDVQKGLEAGGRSFFPLYYLFLYNSVRWASRERREKGGKAKRISTRPFSTRPPDLAAATPCSRDLPPPKARTWAMITATHAERSIVLCVGVRKG